MKIKPVHSHIMIKFVMVAQFDNTLNLMNSQIFGWSAINCLIFPIMILLLFLLFQIFLILLVQLLVSEKSADYFSKSAEMTVYNL